MLPIYFSCRQAYIRQEWIASQNAHHNQDVFRLCPQQDLNEDTLVNAIRKH